DPASFVIDTSRMRLTVDPVKERRGMLWDNYRIMAQQCWRADIDGMDWHAMTSWYDPVVECRVSDDDFQDMMWDGPGAVRTRPPPAARSRRGRAGGRCGDPGGRPAGAPRGRRGRARGRRGQAHRTGAAARRRRAPGGGHAAGRRLRPALPGLGRRAPRAGRRA